MTTAKDLAQEWAQLLFGAPIPRDAYVTSKLAHQLCRPEYEYFQWRLSLGSPPWLNWAVHLAKPRSNDSNHSAALDFDGLPILLSPDGCWPHVVGAHAIRTCVRQGISLAWFDRLDFAHDPPNAAREGPYFQQFPESANGCLSIWAWGLSLTAQALRQLHSDAMMGVIGHSRGGKAALLCAAQDPTIDLVIANNSGTGGAAALAVQEDDAESLHQLVSSFPHWVSQSASHASAQKRIAALDCHTLWSCIAPRTLLILQATDDAWANPVGTKSTFQALTPHWPISTRNERLSLIERTGGHAMQEADWHQASRFMRGAALRSSRQAKPPVA